MKPIVLFLLFGSLPACLWAQHSSNMEKREVAVIRFTGDSAISALELESIIATRTSSWFERLINSINSDWGTPRQFIDELALAEDTIRIFAYYRDHGFFDVHVSDTLHQAPPSPEIEKIIERNPMLPPSKKVPYILEDTVIFRIKEGKPYKVQGFTFEGFERLPMDLQDKVTTNITIKQKSQYSKLALKLERDRVQQILAENGYPFPTLEYTLVEPDTLRKTVTISLRFKTGPRIRVGATRIVYDTAYSKLGYVKESMVRRQMNFDSGAWFNNTDRVRSEQDLARLGTFQYQSVSLDTSQFTAVRDSLRDGLTLPVVIQLRMRATSEITPGIYSGVSSTNQFILGAELSYTERNLFHSADNLNLHASYQALPWFTIERRWNVGGQMLLPYIGIKGVPLILPLNLSYATVYGKYLEEIYSFAPGLNFSSSTLSSPKFSFLPTLSIQYVVRNYYDPSLKPTGDTSFIPPPQFNKILGWDFSVDWRNDPRNPSSGSYIIWSPQLGIPYGTIKSSPSSSFLKNTVQFKSFFDIGKMEDRSVFGFRIFAGDALLFYPNDPTRDILIENHYFGGGTNSLRGWPARSLLVSNNTDPGRPYYGGYKAFETNLEWRVALFNYAAEITAMQQFLSATRLAFFIDAGNVWDKDVPISPKDFAIALGTGGRYNTPFGAIRIDLGFKLYDPYPIGTAGQNRYTYLAIPPGSTGEWLFKRKKTNFWDICNIEFAFGQAF